METMSSCQRCTACQEPVVCTSGILNASITHENDDHAIGCYPCLYCKIRSEQMVIPLSVRGHAPERSLEDMCADHRVTSHQAVSEKMHRNSLPAYQYLSLTSPFSEVNESDIVIISVKAHHHAGLPTWSPHHVGDLH